MTILNKLPTKDRLKTWGIEVEEQWCSYQQGRKSRDHVFFGVEFTKTILEMILQLCIIDRRVGDLAMELQWAMSKLKEKALISIILHIA